MCRVCGGAVGAVVPLHDRNTCMRCNMAKGMGQGYRAPHLAQMASRMRPNPCVAPSVVRALYRGDERPKVVLCTWHARAGMRPIMRPDRITYDSEDEAIDAVEMQPGPNIARYERFDNDPPDVLCSWL